MYNLCDVSFVNALWSDVTLNLQLSDVIIVSTCSAWNVSSNRYVPSCPHLMDTRIPYIIRIQKLSMDT